ncbi:MAG: L,D-transpeptidase [Chelatococcus sp.]|uniref:L,D-transpeptidase n=1 Tax=Chelatococcus sp. TaxID=1953771 RepID=UPI0025C1D6C5|nr:L,D-transpeptidase [Chelatococcus sp.]MBX3536659.1 L,D-transpeptidase [Chelatococcus sp.]
MSISRRGFIVAMPLAVAGCVTHEPRRASISEPAIDPSYLSMYAAIDTEPFPVPAVDLKRLKPQFLRREMAYRTNERPGTIVVDPAARYAYLVMEGGRALRYGIGVGKQEAFNFRGEATIARKAEWPGWRPTDNMIAREPERYGPLRDGLPGGSGNPLGPRALYLYRDGQDTYYRLHGTVEPWTIGTQVSSGCIRLLNQDIMDLYSRVPVGTKAVVLPSTTVATG